VAPGVCNLEESFGRLAEKDATLGAILDNLSEGVVATDARGTVVFANPAGRAMLGMGEEDAELPAPELPAYSRVLMDVLNGDNTLSIRGDEAEQASRVMTPMMQTWADGQVPLEGYQAGSAGPPPLHDAVARP
jgi:signal transduction histidine kinase